MFQVLKVIVSVSLSCSHSCCHCGCVHWMKCAFVSDVHLHVAGQSAQGLRLILCNRACCGIMLCKHLMAKSLFRKDRLVVHLWYVC